MSKRGILAFPDLQLRKYMSMVKRRKFIIAPLQCAMWEHSKQHTQITIIVSASGIEAFWNLQLQYMLTLKSMQASNLQGKFLTLILFCWACTCKSFRLHRCMLSFPTFKVCALCPLNPACMEVPFYKHHVRNNTHNTWVLEAYALSTCVMEDACLPRTVFLSKKYFKH